MCLRIIICGLKGIFYLKYNTYLLVPDTKASACIAIASASAAQDTDWLGTEVGRVGAGGIAEGKTLMPEGPAGVVPGFAGGTRSEVCIKWAAGWLVVTGAAVAVAVVVSGQR